MDVLEYKSFANEKDIQQLAEVVIKIVCIDKQNELQQPATAEEIGLIIFIKKLADNLKTNIITITLEPKVTIKTHFPNPLTTVNKTTATVTIAEVNV